jgi:hypothetical protein
MNPTQTSIVIYESEMARQADQFWMENPEYMIYIMIGAVGFMIVAFIYGYIRHKQFMKYSKQARRRWSRRRW